MLPTGAIKSFGQERGCVSAPAAARSNVSGFGQRRERWDAAAAGPQTDTAALREGTVVDRHF